MVRLAEYLLTVPHII